MHCAIKVTRKTLPFIASLNNDIPLADECLEQTCYFVWGDDLEEPRVYDAQDYHNLYKQQVVVPVRIIEPRVSQAEKLAQVLHLVEQQQIIEEETNGLDAELDEILTTANEGYDGLNESD